MLMPVKIYLADRYSLYRKGLKYILENECNVLVVGEFDEKKDFLEDIACLKPDIVVVSKESYDFLEQLQKLDKTIKYIYIDDDISKNTICNCDSVVSFRCKSVELKRIIEGILGRFIDEDSSIIDKYSLTDREMQILTLLATGLSNKEIANKLLITERTTKNHISSILKKILVNDRTQAALFAIKHNIVAL